MPTIYVFGIIHMYLDVSGSHGDDDKSQWLMSCYQLFFRCILGLQTFMLSNFLLLKLKGWITKLS